MPKTKKIPLRMCIACREMKEKREMLRIVRTSEGEISIDFTSKKSGRGAYICDSEDCIKKLRKQKLINKTFSCDVDESVYNAIEEEFFANKQN